MFAETWAIGAHMALRQDCPNRITNACGIA